MYIVDLRVAILAFSAPGVRKRRFLQEVSVPCMCLGRLRSRPECMLRSTVDDVISPDIVAEMLSFLRSSKASGLLRGTCSALNLVKNHDS